MLFGLINAGATFQHMMDSILRNQIGRNIQVYVDDMIFMEKVASNHVVDLWETFDSVRKHSMHLNPAKCSFG